MQGSVWWWSRFELGSLDLEAWPPPRRTATTMLESSHFNISLQVGELLLFVLYQVLDARYFSLRLSSTKFIGAHSIPPSQHNQAKNPSGQGGMDWAIVGTASAR